MTSVRQGLRDVMSAAIPATIGGLAIGIVDAKVGAGRGLAISTAAKAALAIILGTLLRKPLGPMGTGVLTGAILGTIGHEFGLEIGGKLGISATKKQHMHALLLEASTDDETSALLTEMAAEAGGGSSERTPNAAVRDYEAMLSGIPVPPEYRDVLADDGEGEMGDEIVY